jgi:hypothetical protein
MNEGGLYEWGISLRGSPVKETRKEVSLMGSPKDMLSKALERGLFPWGTRFWGTLRDAPFLGPLKEWDNFIYLGKFLWGI